MTPFTKTTLRTILSAAAAKVESHIEYLNQLDSATGDGDHGTAIVAAMRAAAESAKTADGGLAETLTTIGWGIMGAASGSTSTLTGSFYSGMADGLSDTSATELDTDGVIALFEAGCANVQKSSRAKVGDKTLMDAMLPAITAMVDKRGTGASLKEVFMAAAEAATAGAESTKSLVAKHGRAKNLGERSVGHIDAGATSLALIFQAFAETV